MQYYYVPERKEKRKSMERHYDYHWNFHLSRQLIVLLFETILLKYDRHNCTYVCVYLFYFIF